MAKISKPMLYTAIGAGAIALVFFLYPNNSKATKATKPPIRVAAVKKSTDPLVTDEDYKASFPAYKGPKHDAFLPLVVTGSQSVKGTGDRRGIWTLTGITNINGIASALIENTGNGATQMLQAGDRWADQRVVSVGDQSVKLINAKSQVTELTFPPLYEQPKKGDTAATAEAEPSPAPGVTQPAFLPSITIQAGGGQPQFGGGQGGFPGGGFPGGGQGGFPGGGFGGGQGGPGFGGNVQTDGGGGFPGGFPGGGFPGGNQGGGGN